MATILIAEDDPVIVTLFLKRMQSTRHDVKVARDGQDALQIALSEEPDLIILDLRLPKLDGLSVLKAIRLQRLTMPIIAVTGLDDDDSREQAFLFGANEYVTKPFVFSHLMTCIRVYIG